jgi:hypothetical protein
MAEAVGLVASAISIGQLVGSIQKLQILYHDILDAPKELKDTLDEIELIQRILRSIDDASSNDQRPYLRDSLRHCEAAISALEAVTTRLITPLVDKSKFRLAYRVKTVLKKDKLKELKAKLTSARDTLHCAVTLYYL